MNHQDIGDTISGLAVVGVLSDLLPTVAALAALVWTLIRIYEYVQWKRGKPSYESKDK